MEDENMSSEVELADISSFTDPECADQGICVDPHKVVSAETMRNAVQRNLPYIGDEFKEPASKQELSSRELE